MEIDRTDGRSPNQLRPLACSRSVLNRAHGSANWIQGETKVLAAVYGPKAGTKKNENPEKASIEVIWKPKTGQIGKLEKEYEMILKRTLESICLRTMYPNTTTSVIVQVVHDDGAVSYFNMKKYMGGNLINLKLSPFPTFNAFLQFWANGPMLFIDSVQLLPCAINAACAALVDAGIPLKHLAVAICCCVAEDGYVILDPTKLEEEKMKAFAYLVFPNRIVSVVPEGSLKVSGEPMEHGIITSVTHGAMSVDDYLHCLERGRAACASMSQFLRRNLQKQLAIDSSKAG